MSWIDALYRTYESNKSYIHPDADPLLVPVAHIIQKAHIEVVLDGDGRFRSARPVPVDDQATVIPCTEKSAGRTSSPESHPLSDQLQYVAADHGRFGIAQKNRHVLYRTLLDGWCDSQFAHEWVLAVQTFVKSGQILNRLVEAGLLSPIGDGGLVAGDSTETGKSLAKLLGNADPDRALVRWRVQITAGPAEDRLWKCVDVWHSWINYYLSTKEGSDVCYVTGLTSPVAAQHPKYLRYAGDSAKIISANDTSGYTFRGVFDRAEQVCTVGYDASQRIHSALRWLISRQGRQFDSLVYVAWSVSGKDVPDMLADPLESFFDDMDSAASPNGTFADAGQTFAVRFNKYISGYAAVIDDTERIVVLGVDSATPGRLSVVYYRDLAGSEFLERVSRWHRTGAWPQDYGYDSSAGRRKVFVGVPAPIEIAKAAYGERVDESLKKRVVREIVTCIVDGVPINRQLVDAAYRRTCHRAGKSELEWNKLLGVTCAMVRLRQAHDGGGHIDMALDTTRATRDYLFGRLLAAAEQIERVALEQEGDAKRRPTAATKLLQRFADRPSSTWRSIDTGLTPYRLRLTGSPFAHRYERTIDEVMSLFDPDDFSSDDPLAAQFLLGYHCQRYEYFRPKQSDMEEQENKNADS